MSRRGSGITRTTNDVPFSLHMSIAFSINGAQATSIDSNSLRSAKSRKPDFNFAEAGTHLVQPLFHFGRPNRAGVTDRKKIPGLVGLELDHFSRLIFPQ